MFSSISDSAVTPGDAAHGRIPWWRRLKRKHLLFVAVALLLLGEQVMFLLDGGARNAHAPAVRAHPTSLSGRIEAQVAAALGTSDRGVRRFRLVALRPDARHAGLYTVNLTWAINGDLSLGSVSAGAQAEVFLMMRNLFTAHLPISFVRMTGTFGQQDKHGHDVEVPVLAVGMARSVAQVVDWQDLDATQVWPLLHLYMERPGFECNCQE